jgi:hypothetical protein
MSTYLGRTVTVLEALGAAGGALPSTATVAANIATLVADGATPTQAHVNTLNTNWGLYLTALGLVSGAGVNATDVFETVRNADGSYSKVQLSGVT